MNRKRLRVLLGLLVVTSVGALTAHRLPMFLDPQLASVEGRAFDEIVVRNALAGDARSQYWLGLYYANGTMGRKEDPAEALNWFRKAAESGEGEAQFVLGSLLIGRRGWSFFVPGTPDSIPDREEGLKWLRCAAERGLREAQFTLAAELQHPIGLGPANPTESLQWYRKAAAQGHSEAQCNLGHVYAFGTLGQSKDYSEAIKWYSKAADQSNAEAMLTLAGLYIDGKGVQKDYGEGVELLLQAANCATFDSDVARSAFFQLGLHCESGSIVPRDLIEAYKWFNLCTASGDTKGEVWRDRLVDKMTPKQIAEGQRRATDFLARRDARSQQAREGKQPNSTDGVEATGSGFFVTEDGWFFTSHHVVENAHKIVIQVKGGKFPAKLVKRDAANDLAILKVEGRFRALPVAASGAVQLGESVFTIGFPNVGLQGFEPKLTRGEVSSIAGIQDDPRHFQISVPVQPGNSGGPLVDMRGNVVGIVRMQMDDIKALKITGSLPQNVNYAVKGSLLLSLLESVPGLPAKLKQLHIGKERKLEDVVKEAQEAAALVLVY